MELNFQYAHHSRDESESNSISRPEEALAAFDEFDWVGEVEKANELQKCSPTLSLVFEPDEHLIWVSACGQGERIDFVSESCFPGEVSVFLGFGKKQGTVALYADSFSKAQARRAISLFISGEYEKLRTIYKNA